MRFIQGMNWDLSLTFLGIMGLANLKNAGAFQEL